MSRHGDATYPPLNTLKAVAPDLWIVDGPTIPFGAMPGLKVPFPTRMWKMPEIPVYGREVTIKIPEENKFLLGEMVTITETSKRNLEKQQQKAKK